jgi:hypothetical protein
MIRVDKKVIEKKAGELISPAKAVSYVVGSFKVLDRLIRSAELGMDQTELGTQGHREYIKVLADLDARRFKMAQDISIVPKELGRLQITEEHWIAETSADGTTTVFEAGSPGHETPAIPDVVPDAAG